MTDRPQFDLIDGRFYSGELGDPRQAYAWMRAHQPVYRADGILGAASYEAVLAAERNPELFSNAGGIRPGGRPAAADDRHGRPAAPAASPTRQRRLHPQAGGSEDRPDPGDLRSPHRRRARQGRSGLRARPGRAAPPHAVVGDMLGVRPEERDTFLQWSDDLMNALGSNATPPEELQAQANAYLAFNEFTLRTIEERRQNPTDDLTSILVHSEIDGHRLSDPDIIGETLLILIGGDETTRHVLSGGMEQLMRHPDQQQRLVNDPDGIPAAVEEMLRWSSPIKNMCRTVTRDVEFFGTDLRQGEKMMLLFESANFDESVFEHPEVFDIERSPNPHVAFGFGTTSASATNSPGSKRRSCSSNCCRGCRAWCSSTTARCGVVLPTSCPGSRRCR